MISSQADLNRLATEFLDLEKERSKLYNKLQEHCQNEPVAPFIFSSWEDGLAFEKAKYEWQVEEYRLRKQVDSISLESMRIDLANVLATNQRYQFDYHGVAYSVDTNAKYHIRFISIEKMNHLCQVFLDTSVVGELRDNLRGSAWAYGGKVFSLDADFAIDFVDIEND